MKTPSIISINFTISKMANSSYYKERQTKPLENQYKIKGIWLLRIYGGKMSNGKK